MISRCENPRDARYGYYGARGITVCEAWHTFEAFDADMGPRPSLDYTLERRDNDGPYCPENCCWATRSEQQRNTRQTVFVILGDSTRIAMKDLAERLGVNYRALESRRRRKGDDAFSDIVL
jgi:hypothetical protein